MVETTNKGSDMANETVTISKANYDDLCADAAFLQILENCGVDNWQGYDDANEDFQANFYDVHPAD